MLDAIIQWIIRMRGRTSYDHERGTESVEMLSNSRRGRTTDPRELPRPHRLVLPDKCTESYCMHQRRNSSSHNRLPLNSCSCHNCNELSVDLTECAICLEPISQKYSSNICVTSCDECGNIACGRCATKLQRCPYCRSDPGLVPNFALQRLINRLQVPCKRAKTNWNGTGTERENCENDLIPASPPQTHVLCIHKNCSWKGELSQLAEHMADLHACIVFEGSSISLVISDFKRKAKKSLTKPRNYCLVLLYQSEVFVCKIVLEGTNLKFILVNISRVEITDFGLWIEIGCNSKTMKGVIPFSKKRANVSVCVESWLPLCKKKNDVVSISLKIGSLS